MKKCSVFGCSRKSRARSFCVMHYQRWKKNKTINAPLRKVRKTGETRKDILRDWRYARVAQLHEIKNKPCMDCKNSFPPECMDFDHVRGQKSFSIGPKAASKSWSVIIEEVAKCDIICANCHRIRTRKRIHAALDKVA